MLHCLKDGKWLPADLRSLFAHLVVYHPELEAFAYAQIAFLTAGRHNRFNRRESSGG